MNKARRKVLDEIVEQISTLKEQLEGVLEEEQEYRDNIPENLQGSERYEKADEACDVIDSCVEQLDDVCSQLQELIDG